MLKIALEIDDSNACSTKLYMFVSVMYHIWDTAHILSDELAQNTVSFSMQDSYARHSHQYGVINKVLNRIECFVSTHTSYIKILMEITLVGINRLACLLANAV